VPVRATSAQKEEHGIANIRELIQVKETCRTSKRGVLDSCDQCAEAGAHGWIHNIQIKETCYKYKRPTVRVKETTMFVRPVRRRRSMIGYI